MVANAFKIALVFIISFGVFGADSAPKKISTIVGELSIVEKVEFRRYDIIINGKPVLSTDAGGNKPIDGWPMMSIMADIKNQVGDFHEVIIVKHSMLGNACNNGPIRVIALKQSGEIIVTEPIIHCRNNSPMLIISDSEMLIYYKKFSNKNGDNENEELWVFRNGNLLKATDANLIKKVRQLT